MQLNKFIVFLLLFLSPSQDTLTEKCSVWRKGAKNKGFFYCLFVCLQTQSSTWKIRQVENKLDTSTSATCTSGGCWTWQMTPGSTHFCSTKVPALCVSHCHGNALTFMAQLSPQKTSSHSTPFILQQRNIFPFAMSSFQNGADFDVIKYQQVFSL